MPLTKFRLARTLRPLVCFAGVLACALPGLASPNSSGSVRHSSQSGFTHGYSKNGLPCSTPRATVPAKPLKSGQERELDQMMRQDVSLLGKSSHDRSRSASSYKPLPSESKQGSGINFSGRSNSSGRARSTSTSANRRP